ncbi:hypothetical protein OG241_17635 [Streptomyces sp. NBC_01390]|uniref:hypothetical protein n=1 Tax=Streptomyces sp. NBC_01390 TaxID=2903850 RepID=UPI00324304D8
MWTDSPAAFWGGRVDLARSGIRAKDYAGDWNNPENPPGWTDDYGNTPTFWPDFTRGISHLFTISDLYALEDAVTAQVQRTATAVTGHPAQYVDTDLDTYWSSPDLVGLVDSPAGYNADPNDKSTMSFRDNFTGFWNVWKHGIITRDYALLDEIHPDRIKSAEEWFRREDQAGRESGKGSLWERVQPENWTMESAVLKSSADFRTGKL